MAGVAQVVHRKGSAAVVMIPAVTASSAQDAASVINAVYAVAVTPAQAAAQV